ncbi:MAG: type II toxin-antitoxin system VapC family toxin [Gemmatimonadales bacterium]
MILADTSVWVDHFRYGNEPLRRLLEQGEITCHPWIIGELACGNLRNRAEVLLLLSRLPQAFVVSDDEALALIEGRKLMGKGLGWIDTHLLSAAILEEAGLWTLDRRLAAAAGLLGVSAHPQ